jgi:hypothetical protein
MDKPQRQAGAYKEKQDYKPFYPERINKRSLFFVPEVIFYKRY